MVIFKTKTFITFLATSFAGGYYLNYRRERNKEARELNKEANKKGGTRFSKSKEEES